MNSALILPVAVALALLTGVHAQSVRDCKTVIGELASKETRVFENAEGIANIVSELCVDFEKFR